MDKEIKALRAEQTKIDRRVVDYSLVLLRPFYDHRREVVKEIPRFWSVVVGESEPLHPYITFEDSLAFDALEDLYVKWDTEDSRHFEVSFKFGDNPHFGATTLNKRLVWNENDDEGFYTSPERTEINWKESSNLPSQHLSGGDESFFTWFEYTTTENEENRQENTAIAQILVDEIYPSALDLYIASQDDQDVAEEYDISEDD